VSFDTVDENRHFAEKFSFPFKLLSDTTRAMGIAYGAASSPSASNAKRIAYVIDHGKITHVYDVKKAGEHPQQVLGDLRGN
jgi:peroxiredoxin